MFVGLAHDRLALLIRDPAETGGRTPKIEERKENGEIHRVEAGFGVDDECEGAKWTVTRIVPEAVQENQGASWITWRVDRLTGTPGRLPPCPPNHSVDCYLSCPSLTGVLSRKPHKHGLVRHDCNLECL